LAAEHWLGSGVQKMYTATYGRVMITWPMLESNHNTLPSCNGWQ